MNTSRGHTVSVRHKNCSVTVKRHRTDRDWLHSTPEKSWKTICQKGAQQKGFCYCRLQGEPILQKFFVPLVRSNH